VFIEAKPFRIVLAQAMPKQNIFRTKIGEKLHKKSYPVE
jgi:hypothetical protein